MTEAAYYLSKEAEIILAPFVQHLVGAKEPPRISSPLSAATWDYAFNDDLLVDLKLACKARSYGKISHRTLTDIRKSLESGVVVALLVPPRLYLLFPYDLTWDGRLETLWNRPSVLVPKEVLDRVWNIYSRMTTN
jgi:hypothetical protein